MEEASEFLSPLDALAAKQDHADRRRRLVRNRWQLWWVLYKHPMLQGYRAHALAVMAARDNELHAKAAAGDDEPSTSVIRQISKAAGRVASRGRAANRARAAARAGCVPPTMPPVLEGLHSAGSLAESDGSEARSSRGVSIACSDAP